MAPPSSNGADSAVTGCDVTSADVGSLASLMHLLPFQRQIIHSLIPGSIATREGGEANNDKYMEAANADDADDPDVLLVLARGLGLRTIIASVLRLYDGPSNLVLVLNATPEEETGISEELTTMGVRKPGLQSIGHETNARVRQEQYLSGGLLSVTSRILIVDMLEKRIPIDLITGIVVMHAENITPNCMENFVIVVYREHNKDGFLKAFSDAPDYFAMGINPLQTTLTQLLIRRVELWPRFHKQVIKDLGRRKADVIELRQDMSYSMRRIQNALVECLSTTLGELNRGSGAVDIEDATIENAIFRDFERIVRAQLSRVWNRIGPKTRRMLEDLKELRRLIDFLLSYDAVRFNRYLETYLLSQHNPGNNSTLSRQHNSPWLMEEAANVIFSEAKARVFVGDLSKAMATEAQRRSAARQEHFNDGIDPDEEAAALEVAQETERATTSKRPSWLPPGIEPTLEEQPKWKLLREVLDEIEQDIHVSSTDLTSSRNNTVLIMVADERTCMQIREYLSTMKSSHLGQSGKEERPGKRMMERQLRSYFEWKQNVGRMSNNLRNPQFASTTGAANGGSSTTGIGAAAMQTGRGKGDYQSEALRRKEIWDGGRAPLHKRRRQRGGAAMGTSSTRRDPANASEALELEASGMEEFMRNTERRADDIIQVPSDDEDREADAAASANVFATDFALDDFEHYFGLLRMEDLVIVRAYAGDDDDHHLQELKPRFVVMYDPDPSFIRRLEVFRTAQPGITMRIYFLMYTESVEEQRYLSQIRREKESFERLIREKATMALTLHADGRYTDAATDHDRNLRIINSRMAGGQGASASREPPRVIVDMREFRSDLPFMLYKAAIQVVPRTLQVGDYILSDKMCVERKSPADLAQSFNSGRLYAQCELMSAYYQHPILLIEFEEHKPFSLQTLNDTKIGVRAAAALTRATKPSDFDIQAKLVLLTIAFPRLRLIWSSSPAQTSEIFTELKQNYDEPDASQVAAVGLDEGGGAGAGNSGALGAQAKHRETIPADFASDTSYHMTPQDVLMALPGITTKNYQLVSRSVRDLAELCDMTREEICHLIGAEPGRRLHDFIHKSVQQQ